MAGLAAPTAIDRSSGRTSRSNRRGGNQKSNAPAASDRSAPMRRAREPAARQRPQPDAKRVFGGKLAQHDRPRIFCYRKLAARPPDYDDVTRPGCPLDRSEAVRAVRKI